MTQDVIGQQLDSMKGAFVSGGLVLMAVGALVAWLRNIPSRLLSWLLNRFSVTVEVLSTDGAFDWLAAWLEQQPYSKRARTLSARTRYVDKEERSVVELTPAPGNHFFRQGWRPVWLTRSRDNGGKNGGETSGNSGSPRETLSLRVLGLSQAPIRTLFDDAKRAFDKKYEAKGILYVYHAGGWSHAGSLPDRQLESVVLPDGKATRLRDDMREFLESRQWYQERGVPWRRGYLLHGPPGTGKTSLIVALAQDLGLSVYFMNLSSCSSDNAVQQAFMGVSERSILVLEDIDAAIAEAVVARTRPKEPLGGANEPQSTSPQDLWSSITLSGLLQALDGITSRQGRITIMTTNFPERLEPRLVRAGRVDLWCELGHATREQAARMFERFFPQAAAMSGMFAKRLPAGPFTPADVQAHLLVHRKRPGQAVEDAGRVGGVVTEAPPARPAGKALVRTGLPIQEKIK